MPASNFKYIAHRYREIVVERELFQTLARYLLLATLFCAPWNFGSTLPKRIDPLDDALLLAFGLHLLGVVLEVRLPRYPLIPTCCFVLLIAESAWMACNAKSFLDDDFWEFVPLPQAFPDLPGSWDKADSLFRLKTLSAMTAAFLMAADLMGNAVWRMRLWRTMALAGGSIILYGLLEKALGQDSILAMYHEVENAAVATFFGPYRYHANAGAYLNLIWPVLMALFIHSWRDRNAHVGRAIWSSALGMGIAACFVNTSKGAAMITILMLIISVFVFAGFVRSNIGHSRPASRALATIFIVCIIGILIYGGLSANLQHRMQALVLTTTDSDIRGRLIVSTICLQMIPEAGWFGFGPGTFSKIFPFHTHELGDQIPGFWVYAHEDYLQTVVEFGYVGTVFWTILLFGSIARAIRRGLQSTLRSNDRVIYRATALALVGVSLHSLVDFPLQIASIQLYVMMFFAYAWGSIKNPRPSPEA